MIHLLMQFVTQSRMKKMLLIMAAASCALLTATAAKGACLLEDMKGSTAEVWQQELASALSIGSLGVVQFDPEILVQRHTELARTVKAPKFIVDSVGTAIRSDETRQRLCATLADEVRRFLPEQAESHKLKAALVEPWIQVVFSADTLLGARRDRKYISPFLGRLCSRPPSVGFELMKRMTLVCYASDNPETFGSSPYRELATLMTQRLLVDHDVSLMLSTIRTIEASDGLDTPPPSQSEVVISFVNSYTLLLLDSLTRQEASDALRFLSTAAGTALIGIKQSGRDGRLAKQYLNVVCKQLLGTGLVSTPREVSYLCG